MENNLNKQSLSSKNILNNNLNNNSNPKNNEAIIDDSKENSLDNEKKASQNVTIISTLINGRHSSSSNKTIFNISQEFNKTVYEKALYIQNMHIFFDTYLDQLINILQNIVLTLTKKVTIILDQNKIFLSFYKEIMNSYQRFSVDILKSNSHMHKFDKDKKSPENIFGNINDSIEKAHKNIANKILNFSYTVNNQVISKGPFVKIKELYSKLNLINKNHNILLNEIYVRKEKIIKLNREHAKVTDAIIRAMEKLEFDYKYDETIKKNDLFMLEAQYVKRFNKCIVHIGNLLTANKHLISDFKTLLLDFVSLINDSLNKYFTETDKTFSNLDISDTLKNINNTITKETILAIFKPLALFSDNISLTALSESLFKFACNNNKYIFVINKIANLEETLNLNKFNTIEDLLSFLQTFIPMHIDIFKSNFIKTVFELKRDPGLLRKICQSFIVITYQNNVVIYDETIMSKQIDIFKFEHVTFKIKDEKKFRFELVEDSKKSLFSSAVTFEAGSKEKLAEIENLFNKKI